MIAQGYSLGKQLAVYIPDLIREINSHKYSYFMGRDMDVFYLALKKYFPDKVRYMSGLNRENTGKLLRRDKLKNYFLSFGVGKNDLVVDSGYRGTIFQSLQDSGVQADFCLLTTHEECVAGRNININLNMCRPTILALEHSPKREYVSWNYSKRIPRIEIKNETAINKFYDGVIMAIEGAIIKFYDGVIMAIEGAIEKEVQK